MPPHLIPSEEYPEVLPVGPPRLQGWVRGALVAGVLGLVAVFTIAIRLDPYRGGGVILSGTHRQLGLPPCTFLEMTGRPCPSCGMTSSFALLMRGDLWHSLQANAVGTLLALFCLAVIPWALYCALRGRLLFIRSIEGTLLKLAVGFLVLMLLRWGIVLYLTA